MSWKIIVLVVVFIVLVGFALSIPEISPIYKTVNVVDISLGYGVQTASPEIKNCSLQVTVEQYKTKKIMLTDTVKYEVRNSTRNTFNEHLIQYLQEHNITLIIYHDIKIYINETNQLIFERTFNFTDGNDKSVTIYLDDSVYHLTNGTVLRIEIYFYLKLEIPYLNISYEKTFEKTVYTTVNDNASVDKPNVKVVGVLTQTEKGVAVKVQSFSWFRTWTITDYVLVYLRMNGSIVTDASQLDDYKLGDTVEVSGILSKDLTGNWYLDIYEIKLFEAIQ